MEVTAVDGEAVNDARVVSPTRVDGAAEETVGSTELTITVETASVAAVSVTKVWLRNVVGAAVDGNIVDETAMCSVVVNGAAVDCTGVDKAPREVASVESTSEEKTAVKYESFEIRFNLFHMGGVTSY